VRALILALFLAGCSHSAVVTTNAHPVAPASAAAVVADRSAGNLRCR
jgi:hypothetical protein